MIGHVAIVGYGIAGAAAALFLRRIGVRVSVFEASHADADGGAGLVLQPPALEVLRAAGLTDAMWQVAAPILQIAFKFAASRRRFTLDYL